MEQRTLNPQVGWFESPGAHRSVVAAFERGATVARGGGAGTKAPPWLTPWSEAHPEVTLISCLLVLGLSGIPDHDEPSVTAVTSSRKPILLGTERGVFGEGP